MISVIIPTNSRDEYLEVVLNDLNAQRFSSEQFEVLVIDDGDSHATKRIVEGHALSASHRVIYSVRDGLPGPNAARNTGLRVARGDLVAFLDDDVRIPTSWLSALSHGIDACPDAGCFGGPIRQRIDPGHPSWCEKEPFPITSLDYGPSDRFVDVVYSANMVLRRTAVEQVGPFSESQPIYGDETEWLLRWRRSGGLVGYIAAAGLDHHRRSADVTKIGMLRAAKRRGTNVAAFDRQMMLDHSRGANLHQLFHWTRHAVSRGCWAGATYAVETFYLLLRSRRDPAPPELVFRLR